MESNIIPFGKYKGQPIEILATDDKYRDWLLAQSWFKEQNVNIYNVIINNFREPDNTPEHNKMQIKFLNLDYRLKFAFFVNNNFFEFDSNKIGEEMEKELRENKHAKEIARGIKELKSKPLVTFTNPIFEKVDVQFFVEYGTVIPYSYLAYGGIWGETKKGDALNYTNREYFVIEIKPTISDDFPAVLRQMKISMPTNRFANNILFIGRYTGVGASESEFIEYFGTQGYRVIFDKEIESIVLPNYDEKLSPRESVKEVLRELLG